MYLVFSVRQGSLYRVRIGICQIWPNPS